MQNFEHLKSIEFCLANNIAYVCSDSLTTMRLWMMTSPFVKVDWPSLTVEEKFNVLQTAFKGSKVNVPMPENTDEYSKLILEELGFSTWNKFYKSIYNCRIGLDLEKKEYKFSPMIYSKEKKALIGLKNGNQILSSNSTPEEVIAKLEQVIAKIPALSEDR
jgi:hypothetical protein